MKPWERLDWTAINDRARSGDCFCVRRGDDVAVAKWDGARFVYAGQWGRPLGYEPTHYVP